MDIAKYIGLFLLKNKYCCLQGLGNLEIKKTPAQHNGEALTAAVYYTKLNPIGSIDDSFPNFIANNEQVSIAKASNEISDFIQYAKAKLAQGESVAIPAIGEYLLRNNKLHFELDPAFSLPEKTITFPVAEVPKPEVSELKDGEMKPYESYTNYNNYNKQRSVNWNIIAFWGVIIIIGSSLLGWSISYFMKQQGPEAVAIVEDKPQLVIESPVVPSTIVDSTVTATATITSPTDTADYQFIIKEYKTRAQADKKRKQLTSFGYNASVVTKDSNTYWVVNTVKITAADTTKIKDSLTKLLNPAGVRVLR